MPGGKGRVTRPKYRRSIFAVNFVTMPRIKRPERSDAGR